MSPSVAQRLYAAPEIVVVDLVGAAAHALVIALTLEHPTLDDDPPFGAAPPTLRRARALARAARRLATELDRYRDAIDRSLDVPADDVDF